MADNNNNNKSFFSSLGNFFKGIFVRKPVDLMSVDKIERPIVTVIKRFFAKKISLIAIIFFVVMMIIVFIAPLVYPIDIYYASDTQRNKPPSFSFLSVPKELANAKRISIGPSYGIGVDENGKVFVWGYTKISNFIDLADIPDAVKESNIEWVAAGTDHVVAISDTGEIFAWGDDERAQFGPTPQINCLPIHADYWNNGFGKEVKSLDAGYQVTFVTFTDGTIYAWGNTSVFGRLNALRTSSGKINETENTIDRLVFTDNYVVGLRFDGTVKVFGATSNDPVETVALKNVSEYDADEFPGNYANLYSLIGERKVIDITGSNKEVMLLLEDGTIIACGSNVTLNNFPKTNENMVRLIAGGRHVYGIDKNGDIYAWGMDDLGQLRIPSSVKRMNYFEDNYSLYTSYNGAVVLTEDGDIITWGLRGYLLGTDEQGRDVFARLLNGGRKTLFIGALSVVISSFLGIFIGILSGYFGGWIDIILMRVAEVISSMPFLPFALILSAVLGSKVSIDAKMYIIMVVLGVLSWPGLARLVRGQVLAEREKDFVLAAKAIGVKETGIAFKHIFPNIMSIILVSMTLSFASCMLIESSLSYLGFGVQEPEPTWGNMLTKANTSDVVRDYWWRWVFPAVALGITTISINIMGDGMRDAIDPKSESR